MVEMRMRQQNGVERIRLERQPLPVSQAQRFQALEKAAIDKVAFVASLDQILRTGDGTGRAQKR